MTKYNVTKYDFTKYNVKNIIGQNMKQPGFERQLQRQCSYVSQFGFEAVAEGSGYTRKWA